MKLIPNFAELLHEIKLPAAEKCFLIEDGDEKYIEKWLKNGEIICEWKNLFDWINFEYKLKKTKLNQEEKRLADEVKKGSRRQMACYQNFQRSSKKVPILQKGN